MRSEEISEIPSDRLVFRRYYERATLTHQTTALMIKPTTAAKANTPTMR